MFKHLLVLALALSAHTAFAATDANKASLAQLESLSGIGPALAERMIKERDQSLFKDWADLRARVTGLGAAKAAKLSAAGLTVNGAAFKASAAGSASSPKSEAKTEGK